MTKYIIFKHFFLYFIMFNIELFNKKKLPNFIVLNNIILLSLSEILKLIPKTYYNSYDNITEISYNYTFYFNWIKSILCNSYQKVYGYWKCILYFFFLSNNTYIYFFNYKIHNITRCRHKYNTPITYYYYNFINF